MSCCDRFQREIASFSFTAIEALFDRSATTESENELLRHFSGCSDCLGILEAERNFRSLLRNCATSENSEISEQTIDKILSPIVNFGNKEKPDRLRYKINKFGLPLLVAAMIFMTSLYSIVSSRTDSIFSGLTNFSACAEVKQQQLPIGDSHTNSYKLAHNDLRGELCGCDCGTQTVQCTTLKECEL